MEPFLLALLIVLVFLFLVALGGWAAFRIDDFIRRWRAAGKPRLRDRDDD